MFLSLGKNVLLLEGPQAFGLYDLRNGKFFRLNKKAGQILKELNGTVSINSEVVKLNQKLIEETIYRELVQLLPESRLQAQMIWSEVIKPNQPSVFEWWQKANSICKDCEARFACKAGAGATVPLANSKTRDANIQLYFKCYYPKSKNKKTKTKPSSDA